MKDGQGRISESKGDANKVKLFGKVYLLKQMLLIFTLMCMSYWSQLRSGFEYVELELGRVRE